MATNNPKKGKEINTMENYPYLTAGRTWIFPRVHLKKDPSGTTVISGKEIERMQRSVANEICGVPAPLSPEELEFLCDITCTSFVDVARFLEVSKGSVTFWKKPGKIVPLNVSLRLKRWFWHKVFGLFHELRKSGITMEAISDDRLLLPLLHDLALKHNLVYPIAGNPSAKREGRR